MQKQEMDTTKTATHVSRPSPSQVVLSRALWGCRDHDPEASLYSSPSLAMLPPQLVHLAPLPSCLYTAPHCKCASLIPH